MSPHPPLFCLGSAFTCSVTHRIRFFILSNEINYYGCHSSKHSFLSNIPFFWTVSLLSRKPFFINIVSGIRTVGLYSSFDCDLYISFLRPAPLFRSSPPPPPPQPWNRVHCLRMYSKRRKWNSTRRPLWKDSFLYSKEHNQQETTFFHPPPPPPRFSPQVLYILPYMRWVLFTLIGKCRNTVQGASAKVYFSNSWN